MSNQVKMLVSEMAFIGLRRAGECLAGVTRAVLCNWGYPVIAGATAWGLSHGYGAGAAAFAITSFLAPVFPYGLGNKKKWLDCRV